MYSGNIPNHPPRHVITNTNALLKSISSRMNCSDDSIFPIVPFLFDHYSDFKAFLAQASVSSKLPPKDLNFGGQFAFMTPVQIEATILLEITSPVSRVPVIISLTLDSNSLFSRFGRPR